MYVGKKTAHVVTVAQSSNSPPSVWMISRNEWTIEDSEPGRTAIYRRLTDIKALPKFFLTFVIPLVKFSLGKVLSKPRELAPAFLFQPALGPFATLHFGTS